MYDETFLDFVTEFDELLETYDIKISENKKTEVKEEKKGLIERFLDLFNLL